MIPIAIFWGLIGGLISRFQWWPVPIIGVLWLVILVTGDQPEPLNKIWFAGFVLGAANAAVGVSISRGVMKTVHATFQRGRAKQEVR